MRSRAGPPSRSNRPPLRSWRYAGALFFLLIAARPVAAGPDEITLLCYNVENLFDDVDNGPEYAEYRVSRGGWNRELYLLKISRIARAIRRSVPGGPDIVALQEVENRAALLRLRDRGLGGLGYREAVLVAVAGTATHPAVLSRYPVRRTGLLRIAAEGARGILEVELDVEGRTLYLFNNHWKSRVGGERETEAQRLEAARVLTARLRAILRRDPDADIAVLGDLNEEAREAAGPGAEFPVALVVIDSAEPAASPGPGAAEPKTPPGPGAVEPPDVLFLTGRPRCAGLDGERLVLYEAGRELSRAERCGYVFRGQWQALDHVLLSAGLFDGEGLGYNPGSFRVVRDPDLLDPDTGFPRSWRERGVSDHLPLLVTLQIHD